MLSFFLSFFVFSFSFFFFNDTATTEIYTSFPTRRSSDLSRDGEQIRRSLEIDEDLYVVSNESLSSHNLPDLELLDELKIGRAHV